MKESDEFRKRIEQLETLVSNKRELLTFKMAQQYLGLSSSYLHRLCYTKKIPHHKPTGKVLFFFKDELHAWVERRKKKSVRRME